MAGRKGASTGRARGTTARGTKPKLKHERADSKWKPMHLVQIYRMVRLGFIDKDICGELKISRYTYWNWQQIMPEVAEAIALARKELEDASSFPRWVYSKLSPDLKKLWDQIGQWEEEENGVAKIELMLQDHGKLVRQQLFLHALCTCRFSASSALAKVNVTKAEFDAWINNDAEFAELVSEIEWHKGNFFEEHLVTLVAQDHPAAVLFANKHFNARRGYNAAQQVDVNVNGSILHGVLDLNDLVPYLKLETQTELLEAIRRRDEEKTRRVVPLGLTEIVSQQIAGGTGDE